VGGLVSVVVAPLAWSTVHKIRSMVGAPLAG